MFTSCLEEKHVIHNLKKKSWQLKLFFTPKNKRLCNFTFFLNLYNTFISLVLQIICLCTRDSRHLEHLNTFPLGVSRWLKKTKKGQRLLRDWELLKVTFMCMFFFFFFQYLRVYKCCVQLNRSRFRTKFELSVNWKWKIIIGYTLLIFLPNSSFFYVLSDNPNPKQTILKQPFIHWHFVMLKFLKKKPHFIMYTLVLYNTSVLFPLGSVPKGGHGRTNYHIGTQVLFFFLHCLSVEG